MKKYRFDELINKRNQINWKLFDKIQLDFFSKNKYNLKNRPEKHNDEKTTWEHIQNVVKSAKKIYLPIGITRRIIILSALFHDIGKPYRNHDHGLDSAKVMDKLFAKNKDYSLIRLAVRYHMISINDSIQDYKKIIIDSKKKNIDSKKIIKLILILNKIDILRGRKKSEIDVYTNKPLKKTISEEIKIKKRLFKEALSKLEK
jgi:HD superfamily phosphodiesterase